MAAKKYLKAGPLGYSTEQAGTVISTGAPNGGDIPALDDTGRLDPSTMPVGVGADVAILPATEALAAGNFVNIYSASGTPSVRKADASTTGKEAHGYVLAAFASGISATVYFDGRNTAVTGQTAGPVFLSAATPGTAQATDPAPSGGITQRLGVAVAATEINFEATAPIGRA